MRNIFLILFLFMLPNILISAECSCGSFETGIIDYSVEDETGGCCSGLPTGRGWITTYTQNEGVWEVVDVTALEPSNAQNRCCQLNA